MENSYSSCEWAENALAWPYPSSSSSSSAAAAYLPWPPLFEEDAGGGGFSASKSHSEAEKRRRDRINAQLATLRNLIPMSDKMDKAALLSSVVDHVKELKRKATEISKVLADLPTDTDDVTVSVVDDDEELLIPSRNFIKASVCCDDRPELFGEINSALKDLQLTTVHADVTSLGGRVRSVFMLLCPDMDNNGISINSLKQSLKLALCKIAISSSTTTYRIRSKRQRFFLPAHYH